jgi:hypothetical protein
LEDGEIQNEKIWKLGRKTIRDHKEEATNKYKELGIQHSIEISRGNMGEKLATKESNIKLPLFKEGELPLSINNENPLLELQRFW